MHIATADMQMRLRNFMWRPPRVSLLSRFAGGILDAPANAKRSLA
jgi:hypothetical protein